ncbi:MAG: hypothetical protein AAFZ80_11965, partial [Cyanobacteria bacterium P01_A01_bin.105]
MLLGFRVDLLVERLLALELAEVEDLATGWGWLGSVALSGVRALDLAVDLAVDRVALPLTLRVAVDFEGGADARSGAG